MSLEAASNRVRLDNRAIDLALSAAPWYGSFDDLIRKQVVSELVSKVAQFRQDIDQVVDDELRSEVMRISREGIQ